jgi:hypothetical protein
MTSPQTFVHKNIAVASVFGFHFDVWLALVWTIERVWKGHGHVQVYADAPPFFYDFDTILDRLSLYHGSIKNPTELIKDLHQNTAIDMVIFGTCVIECVGLLFGFLHSLMDACLPVSVTGTKNYWQPGRLETMTISSSLHAFHIIKKNLVGTI